jgi:hypothetical protein
MCSLVAFWGVCGSRGVTITPIIMRIPRTLSIINKSMIPLNATSHRGISFLVVGNGSPLAC